MHLHSVDLGSESMGRFTCVFSMGRSGADYLYHSVQILEGSESRSRITFARPNLTEAQALELLRTRAAQWIADFDGRA